MSLQPPRISTDMLPSRHLCESGCDEGRGVSHLRLNVKDSPKKKTLVQISCRIPLTSATGCTINIHQLKRRQFIQELLWTGRHIAFVLQLFNYLAQSVTLYLQMKVISNLVQRSKVFVVNVCLHSPFRVGPCQCQQSCLHHGFCSCWSWRPSLLGRVRVAHVVSHRSIVKRRWLVSRTLVWP